MKQYYLGAPGKRGIAFAEEKGTIRVAQFFGMPGAVEPAAPECQGIFYLRTAAGRYEGEKLCLRGVEQSENRLCFHMQTMDGHYAIQTEFRLHTQTGVISRKDWLTNQAETADTVYACLPRVSLRDSGFELYGQFSAWSAENQGQWMPVHAGKTALGNSSGRSTDGATPFACLRQKNTGYGAAIHVIPVGDWVIQARRVAAQRAGFVVLEAGLLDDNLHMSMDAGETLELPELLFVGFQTEVEACGEPLQRYLLDRYGRKRLSGLVYNTWFFDFDVIEPERLRQQVPIARRLGCEYFVVDAGWFGKGTDWENQVGCWEECLEGAFRGGMADFADFVRASGMHFGIWMEPERACPGTEVYDRHPEWFLKADTIVYDLTREDVRAYLAGELTRLMKTYKLRWMKLDYNSNMFRDLTGSNFYRYYQGEKKLMEEICRRNPECYFEGCASGGLRTDIFNSLVNFSGHFVSDTVNPLECLRIRQNIAPRMLPAYTGTWSVLQETPMGIGTYFNHNRLTRTKTLSAGDPWWDYTVDVSADFAVKVDLMGQWGISGDISSFGEETQKTLEQAGKFYADHLDFMGRTVCHPLTRLQALHDLTGWTAMQYENVDGKGSLLFVFRLIDDGDELVLFPRNLEPETRYTVRCDGVGLGIMTGEMLTSRGLAVTCTKRYEAKIVEILPCP